MRFTITILVLILCFSSCKEKTERKTEPKKEKTELKVESNKPKVETIEKVDLSKVPDSL
jgi:PBP1b-binding outer membrane lipoprotein LpoB